MNFDCYYCGTSNRFWRSTCTHCGEHLDERRPEAVPFHTEPIDSVYFDKIMEILKAPADSPCHPDNGGIAGLPPGDTFGPGWPE